MFTWNRKRSIGCNFASLGILDSALLHTLPYHYITGVEVIQFDKIWEGAN